MERLIRLASKFEQTLERQQQKEIYSYITNYISGMFGLTGSARYKLLPMGSKTSHYTIVIEKQAELVQIKLGGKIFLDKRPGDSLPFRNQLPKVILSALQNKFPECTFEVETPE